ncbi:MAG: MBL fold metallo-hydrolase [Pseudomonadota bacterium]
MKITLLCENEASAMPWKAEWGFSAWVEYRGTNVLFDMGLSDVWRFNADHAGIDLDTVDVIAFSHIHRDHTKGVLWHGFNAPSGSDAAGADQNRRKRVILHPRVMEPPPDIAEDRSNAAQDYAEIQSVLRRDFAVLESEGPQELAPGAFFLGHIPRVTPFEKGAYKDDPMPDDTALAFRTSKGAVVVSGCSHAGICNISEAAKQVTGQKLHAVIGGFHLLHAEDPPVDETIAWFRDEGVEVLLPMHCVEFDILARFHAELGTRKLGAGSVIELDD